MSSRASIWMASARALLSALQKHLVQLYNEGGHTGTELAELLQVGRSTVYRTLARARAQAAGADAGER